MEELAQTTGETCLLTTVVADRALAVRQVAAPQPVRLTFQPGVMRPLHAGASAKICSRFSPRSTGSGCFARARFEKRTVRSVTDPARLRQQLAQIRVQGYAVTTGEYEEALQGGGCAGDRTRRRGVGFERGRPGARMRDDRLSQATRAVVAAAHTFGARLGGPRTATVPVGSAAGGGHRTAAWTTLAPPANRVRPGRRGISWAMAGDLRSHRGPMAPRSPYPSSSTTRKDPSSPCWTATGMAKAWPRSRARPALGSATSRWNLCTSTAAGPACGASSTCSNGRRRRSPSTRAR